MKTKSSHRDNEVRLKFMYNNVQFKYTYIEYVHIRKKNTQHTGIVYIRNDGWIVL